MKGWLLLILLFSGTTLWAQNLTGQWSGTFNTANNIVAGEGDTEYILELEISGTKVTGYSYSYFNYYPQKYYVICRLEGTYEKESHSVVVNEEERVRGNTPPTWGDCLQTHILTFLKQGSTEKLVGRWRGYKPDGCGVGSTELERKMLTKVAPPKANPPVAKNTTPAQKQPQSGATTGPKTNTQPKPNTQQNAGANKPRPQTPAKKPATTQNNTAKQAPKSQAISPAERQALAQVPERTRDSSRSKLPGVTAPAMPAYGKRDKKVLKTIEVPILEEFKVDFYDNGEIDGDTITVFFNNKMILSKQRLTDKPISIKIKLDPAIEDNELIMYADNLGTIPPNTALMIATIAGRRYEVHITSTEKTSGTIRFRRKPD